MKQHLTKIFAISGLAAVMTLTGCGGPTGMPVANNAQVGAISGSVLGGAIGKQFGKGSGKDLATIVGAVIGGYIGGNMGTQMDAQDRAQLGTAVNTGRPASWTNPSTGNRYTANPGPVYQANYQSQPTVCRPVYIDGYIDGRLERVQMKACKGTNGQWQATK